MATGYNGWGGEGQRRFYVVASSNGYTFEDAAPDHDLQTSVDGLFGQDPQEAWYWDAQPCAGKYIQWDFGPAGILLKGIKWYQDIVGETGTHKLQGSHNGGSGGTWVDLNLPFVLGTSVEEEISCSANETRYRYIRLLGVSGTTDDAPWYTEIDFLSEFNDFEAGNRTSTITATTDLDISSGTASQIVDGTIEQTTGNLRFSVQGIEGKFIEFEFDASLTLTGFAVLWVGAGLGSGVVQPQYWDGSAWQDHEGTFSFSPPGASGVTSTSVRARQIAFSSPSPPATRFRLLGVSGTLDSAPYTSEINFFVAAEAPGDIFLLVPFSFGLGLEATIDEGDFYSFGDRTGFITVTTNLETYEGVPENLVDGAFDWFNNGATDSLGVGLNELGDGDFFVQFALAQPKVITGLKFYKSNSSMFGGTWQWQGSTDGVAWDDIGVPTFYAITNPFQLSLPNSTPYSFYRMLSVSDHTSIGQWVEFEFSVQGETIIQLIEASFSLGADIGHGGFVEPPTRPQVIIVVSGR